MEGERQQNDRTLVNGVPDQRWLPGTSPSGPPSGATSDSIAKHLRAAAPARRQFCVSMFAEVKGSSSSSSSGSSSGSSSSSSSSSNGIMFCQNVRESARKGSASSLTLTRLKSPPTVPIGSRA